MPKGSMPEQISAGHKTAAAPPRWRALVRAFRQVFGIPDYEAYLEHQRRHHPGQPVMDARTFCRVRIDARYGGKGGMRCC